MTKTYKATMTDEVGGQTFTFTANIEAAGWCAAGAKAWKEYGIDYNGVESQTLKVVNIELIEG